MSLWRKRQKTVELDVEELGGNVVPMRTAPIKNSVVQTRPTIEQQDDALRMLKAPENGFLNHAVEIVSDYHALDPELIALFCRGALRTMYDSDSALLHISVSGASGSGKNDIISKVTALIPPAHIVTFSSITPKVLYYSMHVNGVVNPHAYKNKILAVTEINDSGTGNQAWASLKAFSELDANSTFSHATTSGAKNLTLKVVGPRAVWIASVDGPSDSQIRRRFFHVKMSDDNKKTRQLKADTIIDNLLEHKTIETDPRLWAIRAAYECLFLIGLQTKFEPMNASAEALLREISRQLVIDGFNISGVKQFISLAEVAAFEKCCVRHYTRIDEADILEAWSMVQSFNHEVIPEVQVGNKIYEPISPLYKEV